MKLIFADPHIEEKAIPELHDIFEEIIKHEADELIMLGDYYDKKHPSSQEILFGTEWAYKFKKKYKTVIFLVGNHDKTREISAIEYLKYFDINIVESYKDEDNNFYGHFMTNKSRFEYGTHEKTVTQLKKYSKVFLGHQHNYQRINKNIYHLGSIRYINFNEATDDEKFIALLDKDLELIALQTPIKMADITSLTELDKKDYDGYKIRLVISSFDQFKREINQVSEYKKKYPEFKVKLNFNATEEKQTTKSTKAKKLQDIINEGLKQIKDKEVREMLENQFKENE